MIIQRNLYLEKLIVRMHNGMIKVVTGIRRCGKSYLLFKLFYDYLIETGINEDHIIKLALDDRSNRKFRDPDVLYTYVKNRIRDKERYYVILDEVQNVLDFEDVLNGFLHIENVDVYVSGSNAKFLSKDVITEFRGRGDEIRVYPLSFSEFMSVFNGDKYDGMQNYMLYGGMPQLSNFTEEEQKSTYLINLFTETYIKDIIQRNNFRNEDTIEELLNILSSSTGSLSSINKLSNTFKSVKNINVAPQTIKAYIEAFRDSFLIDKAFRYDIKGKKYINATNKYYFTDVGLRNARLDFRQFEPTHIMENIIYNELKIRGFNVDIGVVEDNRKQLEVDFIANLGNKRYYIQSAYRLPDAEKIQTEQRPLMKINDGYRKIVVTGEKIPTVTDEHGIVTMNIYEFLLNQNSLNL